jgi:mannose-6-phosphate isomerase-like protein (cupin superfamily)
MKFDKKNFSNTPYVKRVEKPWGYELHFVPEGKPHMGKLLHIDAGKRLSLQYHDQKIESWWLVSGKAKAIWDNSQGKLVETTLESGRGYTTSIGQRHRLLGITDCDILEVSTPEIGTTYRLEDDYKRPHETEEMRKTKNRGWKQT